MNLGQILNPSKFHFTIAGSKYKTAVQRFRAEEAISECYTVRLWLVSEYRIDPGDMLQKEAVLTINGKKEDRFFHGVINQVSLTGQDGRFYLYQASLVPSFWFLSLNRDFRIFQEKSVAEIAEEVLRASGIPADRYDFRLVNDYEKRRYCTQFGESDWRFVSRLLEEEGIFYFFEHHKDKHVLVLADDTVAYVPIAGESELQYQLGSGMVAEKEVVTGFVFSRGIKPGAVTQTSYNFKRPSLDLTVQQQGETYPEHEIFEYPGDYANPDRGNRLARIRLEEKKTLQDSAQGNSNCPRLVPGCKFRLTRHDFNSLNAQYLLVSVTHTGTQGHVLGEQSGIGGDCSYGNEFQAIPASVTLRPEKLLRKPVVHGPHTAVVAGPEGEDVWPDPEGHLRVKVRFPWDRNGPKGDRSSCWIRVAQSWGGNGWGVQFIPRVGDEVLVAFQHGDPDRPIIVGSSYNAGNQPIYDLPAQKTQSGIRTRSVPGGGGFNELRFEDKKGAEEIFLHAQRDWKIKVENNKTEDVLGASAITVTGPLTEKAKEITLTADSKITLVCGGSRIVMDAGSITIQSPTVKIND